jgi:hypothetical protein
MARNTGFSTLPPANPFAPSTSRSSSPNPRIHRPPHQSFLTLLKPLHQVVSSREGRGAPMPISNAQALRRSRIWPAIPSR